MLTYHLTHHEPSDGVLNDSIANNQLHRVLTRQIVEILRLCTNILKRHKQYRYTFALIWKCAKWK